MNTSINGKIDLNYSRMMALIYVSRLLKNIDKIIGSSMDEKYKYTEIEELVLNFLHTKDIDDIANEVNKDLEEYIKQISRLQNQLNDRL